jgi:hypothetical protein
MSKDKDEAVPFTEASTDSDGTGAMNPIPSSPKSKVGALPWIVMFLALYTFALPWIRFAIIQRYFLEPDWGAVLPGLDSTQSQKWAMGGHMVPGVICLVLGPLQFVGPIRKSCPRIHRWSGRIFCICAMFSAILGLTFIALKGQLVGGYNMSFGFASSGLTVGVLSFKTWQTARTARSSETPDFTAHRNWGIRIYSQMLAPMLYRYSYLALDIFNIYDAPLINREGEECRTDDTCPAYFRWFDMLHCWTYWLTALGIAELIIYGLPKDKDVVGADHASQSNDGDTHSLLQADGNCSSDNDENQANKQPQPIRTNSVIAINIIGWILAAITTAITIKTFTSVDFDSQ